MKRVALFSGGLDSYIGCEMLKSMGYKFETLFVDLNHQYNSAELDAITEIYPQTYIYPSLYGSHCEDLETAHMPGRNLIMSMYAASYGADVIYLFAQKGEQNLPDRSKEFFTSTSALLSYHFDREINLLNPVESFTKAELVQWFIKHRNEFDLFKAFSCYHGTYGNPCSECKACVRFAVALGVNQVDISGVYDLRRLLPFARLTYNDEALVGMDESRADDFRRFFDMYNDVE